MYSRLFNTIQSVQYISFRIFAKPEIHFSGDGKRDLILRSAARHGTAPFPLVPGWLIAHKTLKHFATGHVSGEMPSTKQLHIFIRCCASRELPSLTGYGLFLLPMIAYHIGRPPVTQIIGIKSRAIIEQSA